MARILIADDFSEWRIRARKIVQARPEWKVVCEACDGREAVQRAAELHPDVVLLDIGMPILNGLEAARQIRQASLASRIVFVTQDSDSEIMNAALNTGAEGYVLKANAATELRPAITAALRDGRRSGFIKTLKSGEMDSQFAFEIRLSDWYDLQDINTPKTDDSSDGPCKTRKQIGCDLSLCSTVSAVRGVTTICDDDHTLLC